MGDEKIYGVDPLDEVTPVMVRDALIECFSEAHEDITKECFGEEGREFVGEKSDGISDVNAEMLVKKYFKEKGADFDNPTKEGIINAVDKLAEFSGNFRSQEVIKKHKGEMMKLVDKL
ncbi:hypothetical protein ACFL3M_02735 [Patescibacteria group bacterium]